MKLAVDVHYNSNTAVAGGIAFRDWCDSGETAVYRSLCREPAPYVPGRFFRRELPCILHLLDEHALTPDTIVVDGFVYLDGERVPGLGKHLFDALGNRIPVVGVAKGRYVTAPDSLSVYRGKSRRPLYVTSVGMPISTARDCVLGMHGAYRNPTLLKRVDQLSRGMLR